MTLRGVGASPAVPPALEVGEVAPAGGNPRPMQIPLGPAPEAPGLAVAGPAALALPSVPRFRAGPWAEDGACEAARARIAAAEADPALHAEVAAELLAFAEARLAAGGVATAPAQTPAGFEGLQILPDPNTPLGALAGFLDEAVDGFRLVYSPAKLFAESTRGAVWGFQRLVAAAHDLVFEGRPDPITLHEVEHAVLNLGEEQGRPHPWLGFMQSIDGSPLSEVDEAQGGYLTYCSFQEIPAYAAQVRALARRLDAEPNPGRDLAELEAMARWGRALSGRAADVARRALEHLEAAPEHAIFELRRLTPAERPPEGTPEVLWVSVDRPDVRVSVPLFEPEARPAYDAMTAADGGAPGPWEEARATLLATLRRRLEGVVAGADAARARFVEVETAAGELNALEAPTVGAIKALARKAQRV